MLAFCTGELVHVVLELLQCPVCNSFGLADIQGSQVGRAYQSTDVLLLWSHGSQIVHPYTRTNDNQHDYRGNMTITYHTSNWCGK